MKIKMLISLVIISVFLFAACGSPPLVMPENAETTSEGTVSSRSEQVIEIQSPLAQPTATLKIVEGSARSPLAPPTATAIPETIPTSTPVVNITTTQEIPLPPIPTQRPLATPVMPPPAVKVVSDEPLLSPEILAQMGVKTNDTIWVEAWPSINEIILRATNNPISEVWLLSDGRKQVVPVSNTFPQKETSATAAEELRKYNEAVDYAVVSPDGQWAAWGAWETLLIKRLGTDEPPVNLLGVKYERFEGGSNTLVWSPDSKNIAYVVKNDNAGHYEIRISDPLGKEINVLSLWNTGPSPIVWSPNGQYLAFKTLEQPQSGINHIYLFRPDGNGLTQLTRHGLAKNPIHWSPESTAIVYTHGKGDGSNPWLVTFETR